jgi:hypothetical protein
MLIASASCPLLCLTRPEPEPDSHFLSIDLAEKEIATRLKENGDLGNPQAFPKSVVLDFSFNDLYDADLKFVKDVYETVARWAPSACLTIILAHNRFYYCDKLVLTMLRSAMVDFVCVWFTPFSRLERSEFFALPEEADRNVVKEKLVFLPLEWDIGDDVSRLLSPYFSKSECLDTRSRYQRKMSDLGLL